MQKETPAVAVSFGFPIEVRRGDPDWVALWLARSWIGEHRSSNSHLYGRIRETRGMNYGDYAYIEYFPRGMFQFHPDANLGRQQQIFQVWIRPLRNNNDAHFATRVAMYELDKLIEEGMTETDFEATRAYLGKFVSLLTDGQSRQLGYEIDSQYYEIGDFPTYVREGLGIGLIASAAYSDRQDADLVRRDLSHLLPWETTWVGYDRDKYLRRFQQRFIELLDRMTGENGIIVGRGRAGARRGGARR